MDKYTLLLILNIPFIFFGFIKAFTLHHDNKINRTALFTRIIFWTVILLGLIFNKEIYNYLANRNLTDTTPLSLADVVLVTGVLLCLTISINLYSKVENLEKRLSDIHEEISISQSTNK